MRVLGCGVEGAGERRIKLSGLHGWGDGVLGGCGRGGGLRVCAARGERAGVRYDHLYGICGVHVGGFGGDVEGFYVLISCHSYVKA